MVNVGIELNLNADTVEQLADPPLCADETDTVRDVLLTLKRHNSGTILVCRAGRLIGIFTERDALRHMASRGSDSAAISSVMSRNPITLAVGDSVALAIERMSAGGYRRLPVTDPQGVPVGVVKVSAIVHYLVQHFPAAVYNLPPVPNPALAEREGP